MTGTNYAHSIPDRSEEHWQPLYIHLQNVARISADFAETFEAREWGRLAGALHDIGKSSDAFQDYLRDSVHSDAHRSETVGKVDHSSAGAQWAVDRFGILGHLLAYVISGHHSGLLDGRSDGASLESRLAKRLNGMYDCPHSIAAPRELPLPRALREAIGSRDAFRVAFFVRMLFSCLTDADFLDTEAFMDPQRRADRPSYPDDVLSRMQMSLDRYIEQLRGGTTRINDERHRIRRACETAAIRARGLFTLIVPTGGGKTLSSLAFALRHAQTHGLLRVIYVVPFTSIIEQNAQVFRDAVGKDLVLEHHSNFDTDRETSAGRLAAENWDAPLVITTSVQFYESIFANRSSRCRKLHNLARAVIVLDEAQTLPVTHLEPCLRALKELTQSYGSTVVLCTATQPAVERIEAFPIGLEGVREIMPDPPALYTRLKRVEAQYIGIRSDEDVVSLMCDFDQVLCIVNTRAHARSIYDGFDTDGGVYHLSALMCPEHRTEVLEEIKRSLSNERPCKVVSTQLIEAGVDIDFPVVLRSLAGIDSIAQAAGRCNRNGKGAENGKIFVFRTEDQPAESYFADTANCTVQLVDLYPDLLSLEAARHYFQLYYWDNRSRWDQHNIMSGFHLNQDRRLPFLFDYASVAQRFRLIQEIGRPVIIPWGERGEELVDSLKRSGPFVDYELIRRLQRYTVQIPDQIWFEQLGGGIELLHEKYAILASPELFYSSTTGLGFDDLVDQLIL